MEFTFDTEIAEKALSKGLCVRCIGRLFGKSGTGMTNPERGIIVINKLSEKGVTPNDGPCTLCNDVFDDIELFADTAAEAISDLETENFLIGTRVDPEVSTKETELWKEFGIENAESIKTELNREIGKLVWSKIGRSAEFKNPQVVACVDTQFAGVTLDIAPIFIYGRYNKLSREIPQTIWPCRVCRGKGCPRCKGVGKMYVTSVQEVIGDIAVRMCNGTGHAMHGMGREDIDALMLGTGRPFVLEISDPKTRSIDLAELERESNMSDIAKFRELEFTTREKVLWVKDLAPTKTYKVRVRADGKVNKERVNEVARSIRNLCIDQRTPVRVEHRRADLVRRREILWAEAEWIDDNTFDLTLETGSGTYVKEFVSGDGGRSKPSFSDALGVQCRVETLDVLEVNDKKVEK
jgi:tRNA pseudouridine synthase 10